MYMYIAEHITRSSGGVMAKLLACGARGPGFDSGFATTISENGYLLLPSRDMAERSLKRRKSSNQPTNQPTEHITKSLWVAKVCTNSRSEHAIFECDKHLPITKFDFVSF